MKKVIGLLLVGLVVGASAESRTWSDKKGNELEAEFICMRIGKAVLKGNGGKEYAPEFDDLSEKDQLYIQSILPPEIDIAFSKTQDRRSGSYWMSMQGEVTLEKTSFRMPYNDELHAIFYMFGEDDYLHEYVILDRTESKFNFRDSDTHQIRGNFFRMHDVNSGNHGVEYKGFLVVVFDKDNQIVALKCNRKQFVRHFEDFIKLRKGEHFSTRLESRSDVMHFTHWHPYCHGHHYYWGHH